MNAPLELYLDAKSFLQWVQGREGRYELERGRVVQQMTGRSKPHARLVSNFIGAIRARLDLETWSVTASDLAVRIGDSTRYPDVVVDRLDPPGDPLLAEQPALLVEVLSPSSAVTDLRAKVAEYTSLASLEAYVVASQDAPIVWIWQRRPDRDQAFPPEPVEISGPNAVVTVDRLGLTLPLAELYRGIGHR